MNHSRNAKNSVKRPNARIAETLEELRVQMREAAQRLGEVHLIEPGQDAPVPGDLLLVAQAAQEHHAGQHGRLPGLCRRVLTVHREPESPSKTIQVEPFNEAVLSWNAKVPKDGTLKIELRVRVDGKWL
ncbi:MAG: hypothetical protein IH820_02130, partial [Bacteroidetes bacterium]|nr:hypothetical protein [Bacteroidota bacterium]